MNGFFFGLGLAIGLGAGIPCGVVLALTVAARSLHLPW